MSEVETRISGDPPLDAVTRLLRDNDLPVSDLAATPALRLFACGEGAALSGVVGFELYAGDALLRSLAVAGAERHRGLGARLLAHAEAQARAAGARDIYLLTTTAEDFFRRRGYRHSEGAAAPEAIRATREFASLCPADAAFMHKRLPR